MVDRLRCLFASHLTNMKFLAAVLPALFLISCMGDPRPVKVTIETEEFIPGIVRDVIFEHDGEMINQPETKFDSAGAPNIVGWDSCATGEYSVILTTVFGTETVQKFTVKEDSNLLVKNNLPFKQVGFLSEDSMLKADTVQFVRVVNGRYESDKHEVILIRTYDGYEYSEYPVRPFETQTAQHITTEEGVQLIEEFLASEREMEQLRYDHAAETMASSARQYVFIRADTEVYAYHDDASKWIPYPQVYFP